MTAGEKPSSFPATAADILDARAYVEVCKLSRSRELKTNIPIEAGRQEGKLKA